MTNWPAASPNEMAWIGADSMREIDRQMVDELGVVLLQMMENAVCSWTNRFSSITDPHSGAAADRKDSYISNAAEAAHE